MNKKNEVDKGKIKNLKIIGLVGVGLIVGYATINPFKLKSDNVLSNVNEVQNSSIIYKRVNEYKSLEDIIKDFNCTFIKKEKINGCTKIYLKFDVDLYSGNISNETHFLNICKVIAEFLNCSNFELIDNDKNIDIEVECEENDITVLKINGDLNYYLNNDSKKNKKINNESVNFSIQSSELQKLIDENWNETKVNFGTKDSKCNGYNIFFDEGIEYKCVDKRVYNLIFTSKYNGNIAGGLNVNSTPEEVEKALGTPTFSNYKVLYGYLGEKCYLFFDFSNKEISVYPVSKVSEQDEEKIKEAIIKMNNTSDIKEFATTLTRIWNDYDVYKYDSDYVDLRYTLKGFELLIDGNSLNNGIFIYPNYSGNRDILDLENVYMKDEDFVFSIEIERSSTSNLSRIEQGNITDELYNKILGKDFSVRFDEVSSNKNKYFKGAKFYSRDKEYPDSELDRTLEISSYMWFDNSKFVYSIDDDGIYLYDCVTRVSVKLLDFDGKIIINSIENNTITYNEKQTVNLIVN